MDDLFFWDFEEVSRTRCFLNGAENTRASGSRDVFLFLKMKDLSMLVPRG